MGATVQTFWRRLWYTRWRDALRGRFNASLDWRLVVADAELPTEVADVIGHVVGRTRLWRGERVDVAKELIAHFQDGLAAGRTPKQLVESFGDPVAAAQLIRRAKKRGRPIAWHVWHYGWLTLAGLCLAYIIAGLYMMTDRPSVKVDYMAIINERAASVPESERAWPLPEALLALGVKFKWPNVPDELTAIGDARPGDATWPETETFLRGHADSIAKLRSAAGRRDLGFVTAMSFAAFPSEDQKLFGVSVTKEQMEDFKSDTLEDHWLIAALLPDLQLLRSSAYLLSADARRAAAAGDADTALADTIALLGVARHCQETPFLVNLLVANLVNKLFCGVIQETLADHPRLWSDDQLRDLAHAFAASTIDWRRGYGGEHVSFQDVMQRFYTDDGHGNGRLAFRSSVQQNIFELLDSITGPGGGQTSSFYTHDSLAMFLLPAANMVVASRKDMTEAYERFINFSIAQIDTPLWKQQELVRPDDHMLSEQAGRIERFRYIFVRILDPAHDKLRNTVATAVGTRDGVLVGIALELFHREHGAWPKTMDELAPRWLPSVPVDRITGEPLRYKIMNDGPVVYSVGVDRDDDGGREPLDDGGKPDDELASPKSFQLQPVTDSAHDGDWVIWSTAKYGKQASMSD